MEVRKGPRYNWTLNNQFGVVNRYETAQEAGDALLETDEIDRRDLYIDYDPENN